MADSASRAAQRPPDGSVWRSYLLIACEDDASSHRAVAAPASAARSREPPLAAAAADAVRALSAQGRDHVGDSDAAPARIPLKTIPSYRVFTSATGAAPRVIVSRAQAQTEAAVRAALHTAAAIAGARGREAAFPLFTPAILTDAQRATIGQQPPPQQPNSTPAAAPKSTLVPFDGAPPSLADRDSENTEPTAAQNSSCSVEPACEVDFASSGPSVGGTLDDVATRTASASHESAASAESARASRASAAIATIAACVGAAKRGDNNRSGGDIDFSAAETEDAEDSATSEASGASEAYMSGRVAAASSAQAAQREINESVALLPIAQWITSAATAASGHVSAAGVAAAAAEADDCKSLAVSQTSTPGTVPSFASVSAAFLDQFAPPPPPPAASTAVGAVHSAVSRALTNGSHSSSSSTPASSPSSSSAASSLAFSLAHTNVPLPHSTAQLISRVDAEIRAVLNAVTAHRNDAVSAVDGTLNPALILGTLPHLSQAHTGRPNCAGLQPDVFPAPSAAPPPTTEEFASAPRALPFSVDRHAMSSASNTRVFDSAGALRAHLPSLSSSSSSSATAFDPMSRSELASHRSSSELSSGSHVSTLSTLSSLDGLSPPHAGHSSVHNSHTAFDSQSQSHSQSQSQSDFQSESPASTLFSLSHSHSHSSSLLSDLSTSSLVSMASLSSFESAAHSNQSPPHLCAPFASSSAAATFHSASASASASVSASASAMAPRAVATGPASFVTNRGISEQFQTDESMTAAALASIPARHREEIEARGRMSLLIEPTTANI